MSEDINVQFVELERISVTITGAVPPTPVGNLKSGLDALKSASPESGDVFLATDTGIFYVCFIAGTWSVPFILSLPASGEYKIKSIKFAADGKYVVEYDKTPTP